ncbi:FimV/HubP family polar landmark protein [Psychrobacter sp. CAL346-MNA-CIBAN-0220]|uniref:FimV/HubP family polar landmark protein n=1 Tax=Psychrobacter sp. CAL346-MNA-CIBAN-0220 TaxID=3140457 RepID=UPI003317E64F
MDNMLYIIAGLVILLLIGVLVLRRNKAQRAPTQAFIQAGENSTANTLIPESYAARTSLDQKATKQTATKFDPLTIAQRFIDQQRYDKAIEAIERGLIKTPQDSQMSLKLLNIYIITNQYKEFSSVYNAIEAHSDAEAIAEARQLRTLLDQDLIAQPLYSPTSSSRDHLNVSSRVSLPADSTQSNSHHSATSPTNIDATQDNIPLDVKPAAQNSVNTELPVVTTDLNDSDAFDITLDDLEANTIESTTNDYSDLNFYASKESKLKEGQLNDDPSKKYTATDDLDATHLDISENIDDDFTLDFDTLDFDSNSDTELFSEAAQIDRAQKDSSPDVGVDDDFVLDFDDLIEESDDLTASTDTATSMFEHKTVDEDTQLDNYADFDILSTAATATAAVDVMNDNPSLIASDSVNIQDRNTTLATDFAAQFAGDFDFVKTLDSNQVTLDLAGQYLQLGEYDSAKRLLNEVIAQGNSEQQNQAQELLARTA